MRLLCSPSGPDHLNCYLPSGVDITVIALWLGHESLETTHVYIEADLQMKQQALEKVEPAGQSFRRFTPSDDLLAFLSAL